MRTGNSAFAVKRRKSDYDNEDDASDVDDEGRTQFEKGMVHYDAPPRARLVAGYCALK